VSLAAVGALCLSTASIPARAVEDPSSQRSGLAQPTSGPLSDPDDPSVDTSTIIAITRDGAAVSMIREAVSEATPDDSYSTLSLKSAAGSKFQVASIRTEEEAGPDLAAELVDSGLFEAVDYDTKSYLHYGAYPNDVDFSDTINMPYPTQSWWSIVPRQWGLKDSFAIGSYGTGRGSNFAGAWAQLAAMGSSLAPPDTAPVAVIDSGCALDHRDHGPNMVAGYDFGEGKATVLPAQPWLLDSFHGSGVASVIGSATNNGHYGAGAAWDNKVICYKATDAEDNLTSLGIIQSLLDAPTKGAKVINLSLGGPQPNSVQKWAIDQALGQGVVVVASAGNDGANPGNGEAWNKANYPAAFPGVISVGAMNLLGVRASFSNWNPVNHVDLVGPGEDVYGWGPDSITGSEQLFCFYNGFVCMWDGTSFSSPMVAAAAALVMRVKPGLSPAAVKSILTSTTRSIPGGKSEIGAGLLDANAAVTKARASTTPAFFNLSNNGVIGVPVRAQFSVPLGIGGNPQPTAKLASGSSLPAGVTLNNAGVAGWQLKGSLAKSGSYSFSITASVGSFSKTQLVTLIAGCPGFFKTVDAKLSKATITAGEAASVIVSTTQDGAKAACGGFTLHDRTTNTPLGSGEWATGNVTFTVPGLAVGRHDVWITFTSAVIGYAETYDPEQVGVLTVIAPTNPGGSDPPPSAGVTLPKPTITPDTKGTVVFDPSTVAPGTTGAVEVVDLSTGKIVGVGVWTSGSKIIISLMPLGVGKHRLQLKVTIAGGKPFTLDGGTITIAKGPATVKLKVKKGKLTITVTSKGTKTVKGKVKVKIGKGKAKTLKLKKGKTTIALPKGKSKVTVTFPGTKTIAQKKVAKTLRG